MDGSAPSWPSSFWKKKNLFNFPPLGAINEETPTEIKLMHSSSTSVFIATTLSTKQQFQHRTTRQSLRTTAPLSIDPADFRQPIEISSAGKQDNQLSWAADETLRIAAVLFSAWDLSWIYKRQAFFVLKRQSQGDNNPINYKLLFYIIFVFFS